MSLQMSVDEPSTSTQRSNELGTIPKNGGGCNKRQRTVGGQRGVRRGNRAICEVIRTRPSREALATKKGEIGDLIRLKTNYFKVVASKFNVYKYHVDFTPDIDSKNARKAVIFRQKPKLGDVLFDGTLIFSPIRFSNEQMQLIDKDTNDKPLQIAIKFVGSSYSTDLQYMQILNIITRTSIKQLNMIETYGSNRSNCYFDPQETITRQEHGIQIIPGFITSIRQHEQNIMMCMELTHKVIRMDNCYSAMRKTTNHTQDSIKRELIGQIVVTLYNNKKTYRIDDVDFSLTPRSTFKKSNGEDITYWQYFRDRYNIRVHDMEQPLLVSRPKARDIRGGRNEMVNLIPELCNFTGLTDRMRSNYRLMSDLAQQTCLNPDRRILKYLKFMRRIQKEPRSNEVMHKWNMSFNPELEDLPGRVLPVEPILIPNREIKPQNADWTRAIMKNSLYPKDIKVFKNWHCICTNRDVGVVKEFISIMLKLARDMGVNIKDPQLIQISDKRVYSYLHALDQAYNNSSQIVMVVLPTLDAHLYGSIKKQTLCQRPMPSQCVLMKVLQKDRVLRTVAAKILIQMNCKIGNVPWSVKIPAEGIMTIGFDVTYDTSDKSKSYGALVATMDLRSSDKFYSTVSQHKHGEEMSNFLVVNVMKALRQYEEIHQNVPKKIIFYRDGVGEGDLTHVLEFEVNKLRDDLKTMYKERAPKLTYIIVTKKINTRLFQMRGHQGTNPSPGTIVDDVITLPERYDFFLISQSTRQGTISPTSYNVIFDESGFKPDRLQIWTYKMTHLYFNWSGNVKVPAVCQYAHKLAFLVGQYLHRLPSELIADQLYFL